jgi:transcriptional regulator with XRE-family HTH domain
MPVGMHQPTEEASFGAVLRGHRLSQDLTQEALAERAGLSRRGIADLERGARSTPYRDTVARLAAALGLSDSEREVLVDAAHSARVRRPSLALFSQEGRTSGGAHLIRF